MKKEEELINEWLKTNKPTIIEPVEHKQPKVFPDIPEKYAKQLEENIRQYKLEQSKSKPSRPFRRQNNSTFSYIESIDETKFNYGN